MDDYLDTTRVWYVGLKCADCTVGRHANGNAVNGIHTLPCNAGKAMLTTPPYLAA